MDRLKSERNRLCMMLDKSPHSLFIEFCENEGKYFQKRILIFKIYFALLTIMACHVWLFELIQSYLVTVLAVDNEVGIESVKEWA